MAYQRLNPATGKVLETFEPRTGAQLEQKLAQAAQCYETWRRKTYAARALIVAKAAELLHEKAVVSARPLTLAKGKRINETRGEVHCRSTLLAPSAHTPRLSRAPQPRPPTVRHAPT